MSIEKRSFLQRFIIMFIVTCIIFFNFNKPDKVKAGGLPIEVVSVEAALVVLGTLAVNMGYVSQNGDIQVMQKIENDFITSKTLAGMGLGALGNGYFTLAKDTIDGWKAILSKTKEVPIVHLGTSVYGLLSNAIDYNYPLGSVITLRISNTNGDTSDSVDMGRHITAVGYEGNYGASVINNSYLKATPQYFKLDNTSKTFVYVSISADGVNYISEDPLGWSMPNNWAGYDSFYIRGQNTVSIEAMTDTIDMTQSMSGYAEDLYKTKSDGSVDVADGNVVVNTGSLTKDSALTQTKDIAREAVKETTLEQDQAIDISGAAEGGVAAVSGAVGFDRFYHTWDKLLNMNTSKGTPPVISFNFRSLWVAATSRFGAPSYPFGQDIYTLFDFGMLNNYSFGGFTLIDYFRNIVGIGFVLQTLYYVWKKFTPREIID